MIHLEKINGENIWDILKLNVSDSQKNFQIVRKILSPAIILVLLKRISLLHPTDMLFHLEFLKAITQSAL